MLRASAMFAGSGSSGLVNISAAGVSPRLGGVQTQLASRLRAERALRPVALLSPDALDLSTPRRHLRWVPAFTPTAEPFSPSFERAVREALAITGAQTIHLEGTSGVPVGSVLRLRESGVRVIVSAHDFSLFSTRTHQPAVEEQRLPLARELLAASAGLIFPSQYLLERYRQLASLPLADAEIVEPGVERFDAMTVGDRRVMAVAGSVQPHKGAQLLPALIESLDGSAIEWHIFGGGDETLLRALWRLPQVAVHGYYRAGLPSLLARHRVGLVVLPSIVPESFSLTLSESWRAGIPVAAFDQGALGGRIRRHGGGFLAADVAGLAKIVEEWVEGSLATTVPATVAAPEDSARRHLELYRGWNVP
jgi:hypothetical protein